MNALRITAGSLRGRRLPVPKDQVRPTSERARQAFFDIVGPRIVDARFLDLFAGTGIFSFEAVSRGAKEAVAVDNSRAQIGAIEKAAQELSVPIRPVIAEMPAAIRRLPQDDYDVVYADPPYSYDQYDELLLAIDREVALAPEAVVAIEHRRRTEPFTATLERLQTSRRAEYGEVWITFFIA